MTSTPPTTLVVSLIFVFVVLFALGVYWLLRKPQPTRLRPISIRPDAWPADPRLPDSQEDEWESSAPYPDHAIHFAQQAHPTPDLADVASASYEETQPEVASPPVAGVPSIRCPRCLSSRIDTRNVARKAGSTIGSVAGATGGMAAALVGAETGAVVGAFAGPMGSVFGGLAGAVIAGLVGSAAGCAAGSAVGAAIDDNVLDNHHCLACGYVFSVAQH